jgi:predicted nucleotide-binding protein (sugar kinase/HSP70/actin superfamily)
MAGGGVRLLAAAFRAVGIDAEAAPASDSRTLELGSRYTSGDECFPAKVTIGDFMKVLGDPRNDPSEIVLFMPLADGPCRFGQYAPYLRSVLDKSGYGQVRILSPNCEDGYAGLGRLARPFFRTAWRAVVAGDILEKALLMTRPYEMRRGAADEAHRESIEKLSKVIAAAPLRVAGIIIWTKLRQEYLNSEVRECSSSRDESCGGGRGVLPFGTLSL